MRNQPRSTRIVIATLYLSVRSIRSRLRNSTDNPMVHPRFVENMRIEYKTALANLGAVRTSLAGLTIAA